MSEGFDLFSETNVQLTHACSNKFSAWLNSDQKFGFFFLALPIEFIQLSAQKKIELEKINNA